MQSKVRTDLVFRGPHDLEGVWSGGWGRDTATKAEARA